MSLDTLLAQHPDVTLAEIGPGELGQHFKGFLGLLLIENDGHMVIGVPEGQDPGERFLIVGTLLTQAGDAR
jgi:hypothetical protein